MEPSCIRDGTRVSCIGRQILYRGATREAPRAETFLLIFVFRFSAFFCRDKWTFILPALHSPCLILLCITPTSGFTRASGQFSSVQFSRSVVSDSLWPHGLQHARPPCPSPTPGVYSNSCPLSQWCHPTISSSVVPFSRLQSFPASGSFQIESVLCIRLSKYWSFSFSISPSSEYSGPISFRMNWLDLLAVQGTLKSLLQHHSSKASILQCSAFFIFQLSHPYMTPGKTIALTRWTFVGKVMSLLLAVRFIALLYFFFNNLYFSCIFKNCLFIWLHRVLVAECRILIASYGILHGGAGTLVIQNVQPQWLQHSGLVAPRYVGS